MADVLVDHCESKPDTSSLYTCDKIVTGVHGFDAIGEAEVRQFHEQGFLVVHDAFTPQETTDALDGLVDLINGKNPEFRGIQFESKAAKQLNELTSEQKQDAVRKIMSFVKFDARLQALSENSRLSAALTRLMSGEAPVLFQDMGLIKPPKIGREKPWHQDCAYFNFKPGTTVVGCWIALDEATPENGCMHIIPGSHREGPVIHFNRRDWQICDTNVQTKRQVMAPLKPGGCLLFHGLMHHGTPDNCSAQRRRALQYHYKPASCQDISGDERLQIFGSEGKNVEC